MASDKKLTEVRIDIEGSSGSYLALRTHTPDDNSIHAVNHVLNDLISFMKKHNVPFKGYETLVPAHCWQGGELSQVFFMVQFENDADKEQGKEKLNEFMNSLNLNLQSGSVQ